jgi:hypothetical protein
MEFPGEIKLFVYKNSEVYREVFGRVSLATNSLYLRELFTIFDCCTKKLCKS